MKKRAFIGIVLVFALVQMACGFGAPGQAAATGTAPNPEAVSPTSTASLSITPTSVAAATAADTPTPAVTGPGYVVINPVVNVEKDMQDAFAQTAAGLGAHASMFSDNYDTNQDLSLVTDAIQAGAKGIAIQVFAPVTSLGKNIARAARAAGVPLLTIITPIRDEQGKLLPIVRFDDQEMGKTAGETAAKLVLENGWMKDPAKKVGFLSLEVNNQLFCNKRTIAEKAALHTAGVQDRQIFSLQYDNIMIDSQDKAPAVIKAHADITNWVVTGCDDAGIAGALKAFAAAGIPTDAVIAVGIGGNEACIPWAKGQPTGFRASVVASYRDLGNLAATILNEAVVNGKPIPPLTIVPSLIADPANYKTTLDPVRLAACGN